MQLLTSLNKERLIATREYEVINFTVKETVRAAFEGPLKKADKTVHRCLCKKAELGAVTMEYVVSLWT